MLRAHIDISRGLDGEAVVLACFDLGEDELAASAHAVAAAAAERYRTAAMTSDDVLGLRELTTLTDELRDLALRAGLRTVVLRPARLAAYRDAVAFFVESRDAAEWRRGGGKTRGAPQGARPQLRDLRPNPPPPHPPLSLGALRAAPLTDDRQVVP